MKRHFTANYGELNHVWSSRKILLTGYTGFKGSWLALWLQRLGAHVTGISLPPTTTPNLFTLLNFSTSQLLNHHYCDLRDKDALSGIVQQAAPEIVFHLAAQPLVRASYTDPLGTFSTNVMGTANLLEALRSAPSVRVIVVITTDKVYANREWPYPYREDDHLGGHDPYSASKACTELVTACYRQSFFPPPQPLNFSTLQRRSPGVALATARSGNVIGGGDWSEDRLIPDAIRAWESNTSLDIRNPRAVRPWQHVLEPLHGYLTLAQALWNSPDLAEAYNFGPYTHEAATVREVVELAREAYGKGEITWGEGNQGPHEAGLLKLDISKAQSVLEYKPRWSLAEAIERTMAWYKKLEEGKDVRELCEADIAEYEGLSR